MTGGQGGLSIASHAFHAAWLCVAKIVAGMDVLSVQIQPGSAGLECHPWREEGYQEPAATSSRSPWALLTMARNSFCAKLQSKNLPHRQGFVTCRACNKPAAETRERGRAACLIHKTEAPKHSTARSGCRTREKKVSVVATRVENKYLDAPRPPQYPHPSTLHAQRWFLSIHLACRLFVRLLLLRCSPPTICLVQVGPSTARLLRNVHEPPHPRSAQRPMRSNTNLNTVKVPAYLALSGSPSWNHLSSGTQ